MRRLWRWLRRLWLRILRRDMLTVDDANFYVGMTIEGPPEIFGLPPSRGIEGEPATIVDVDEKRGIITLSRG